MFSRDELIHIYESITDENLKNKIHDRIFINNDVVDCIKATYSNYGLLKIEKSNNKNSYTVHLVSDYNCYELVELSVDIIDKFKYLSNNLDIDIITHENIEDVWSRNNYYEIYNNIV